MAQVERFEDKVKQALREAMRHAVSGHNKGGMNVFCNNPDHALHILAEQGIRPANAAILDTLDKRA